MKFIYGFALFLVTFLAANVLHAQTNQAEWLAIEETSPLEASQLPIIATYFSAANPSLPPAPGNLFGLSGWILDSTNNICLLDDLPGAPGGGSFAMDDSEPSLPEGDSDTNEIIGSFVDTASFPASGLYLSISNISDGTVYANLYNGTDTVYEIFSTTNLSAVVPAVSNWDIESEVMPDNTNMPFTVSQNGRNLLFLWARDWTDITHNGNSVPDWWFWGYYNTTDLSDTNLDASGNTLFYDYTNYIAPTAPPALSIIWPQDGTPISGSNFTLQAQVGGPAVSVITSIVDTNGDTNVVQGLVEQSGAVWVQNLPLAAGTNVLTVTATDTLGHQTTTNLTVIQSSVMVTMNPLTSDQLNQPSVNVSGTVSDATSDVFVNGVEATNNDGTWEATNVPVSPTDVAVFNLEVYVGDPVLETSQNYVQPQPPKVVLSSFSDLAYLSVSNEDDEGPAFYEESDSWNWNNGGPLYFDDFYYFISYSSIPPDGPGFAAPLWDDIINPTYLAPVWEQSAITYDDGNNFELRTNQTEVMLVPGGGQLQGTLATYLVLAHASEFSVPPLINPNRNLYADSNGWSFLFCLEPPSWYSADVPLPPEWLQINGNTLINTGITNADGSVWGAMTTNVMAGNPVDVTVNATEVHSNNDYTFDVKAYQLDSQCVFTTPANQSRTNLGVGEQVNLFFNPSLPPNFTNIMWSATAGSLSVTNGAETLFTAPNRATNATITATVANVSLSIPFNILEPTNVYYTLASLIHVYDEADIGFYAWVYLQPDSVNFGNVLVQEEAANYVANGVYSQYNGGSHQANIVVSLVDIVTPGRGTGPAKLPDECYSGQTDPALNIPYANGTETLIVPWDFTVGSNDTWKTNFVTLTWHCSKSDGGDHGDGVLNASKSNESVQMNVDDPSVGSP